MAGVHTLETEMEIGLPLGEVFAFFANPRNLERITPPELGFKILTPGPLDIEKGTQFDYRLRLFGIGFRWTSRISKWEPPEVFIDDQVRGPYRQWVHTHLFTEQGGVTTIRDRVRYRLPLWPVGDIAYPLVHMQLRRIFKYRQVAIRGFFEGQGAR